MVEGKPPRSEDDLLKSLSHQYRFCPLRGAVSELADLDCQNHSPTSIDNNNPIGKKTGSSSSNIMSNSELVSAVGKMWDCATRPLAGFQPRSSLRHYTDDLEKEIVLCCPATDGNKKVCTLATGQNSSANLMNYCHSPPILQLCIESLKVTQKMPALECCGENQIHSVFWNFLLGNSGIPRSLKEKGILNVGRSYDIGSTYRWMNDIALARPQMNSSQIQSNDECNSPTDISCDSSSLNNNLIIGDPHILTEATKSIDSPSCQAEVSTASTREPVKSLYSNHNHNPVQNIVAHAKTYRTLCSRLLTDYHDSNFASANYACEENLHITNDCLLNNRKYEKEIGTEDLSDVKICVSKHKSHYAVAKQEHALAGAMAGIFVSLCLHPLDTIKTVIQSCHTNQKSIHAIGQSIISERGLRGLYRGITSNVASSAPISAVYTFTYESVKGALLPFFPMEYQSLAHCMAGGCASIATSFIFTPSERIKQQMQVGPHYQNCWNAFTGIIAKGGLPSLYAGWGAVLCRNVPQSIIKFYTYESLKQLMSLSLQTNAQPSTLQTLVCGGLAGSTAALFTTPFDVVKTRLQTQIPGHGNQYGGVLNVLKDIGKQEGFKGLYRGLIPRLIMYMTQGALFFASYESFKKVFSLDLLQLNPQTFPCEENVEDDLTTL